MYNTYHRRQPNYGDSTSYKWHILHTAIIKQYLTADINGECNCFSSLRRKEITLFFAFFSCSFAIQSFFLCFQHITLM